MPAVLLLIALDVLVIVLWVIAVCLLISVIMGFISGQLSGLPFPLDKLAGPVKSLAQGISNACGKAISKAEGYVGSSWHALASYFTKIWHNFEADAHLIAHLAEVVGGKFAQVTGLSSLVHRLERAFHGIEHGIKTLTREWHGIDRRVTTLEHDLAKGIGNDVLPRVRSLEREVGHLENKVIPKVESAEQALQNDITQLGEYIRANFLSSTTDAITAAVAVGLAALGLGGLRCGSFRGLLNKFGCGLGSLLNDLIGLALSVLALESVCAFLPVLEEAFGAVVGPMVHLLNEVPLGACEQPPKSFATLSVAAGPQPPPQTLGSLPTG